jgi:hypothetical protein
VIPKLENADWRQQALSKRKRGYLPEGASGRDQAVTMETEEADETRVGLQISKRVKVEQQTATTDHESLPSSMDINTETTTTATTTTIVEDSKEETLEEMAARKIVEGNIANVGVNCFWNMDQLKAAS